LTAKAKTRRNSPARPKLPSNNALERAANPTERRPDLITMGQKVDEAKRLGLIKPGAGPYHAIMALLDFYAADWAYWVGRYNAMEEETVERDDKDSNWVRRQVYGASKRLQQMSKEIAALGIEEKKVNLEQAKVLVIVQALEAAMSVAGVDETTQMKIMGHMARQLNLPAPELAAPPVIEGKVAA
jgi:hypothetical protein